MFVHMHLVPDLLLRLGVRRVRGHEEWEVKSEDQIWRGFTRDQYGSSLL
jgi:hypothetical protein